MVNTLIGGCCGTVFSFFARSQIFKMADPINTTDIQSLSNGMIAGMISVCANAESLRPLETIITGVLASLTYHILVFIFEKLEIDDPIEASQVHIGGGFIGLVSVGLFDEKLGYFHGNGLQQLSYQLLGAIAIIFWSAAISLAFFKVMARLGRLRISKMLELLGLDVIFEGII